MSAGILWNSTAVGANFLEAYISQKTLFLCSVHTLYIQERIQGGGNVKVMTPPPLGETNIFPLNDFMSTTPKSTQS